MTRRERPVEQLLREGDLTLEGRLWEASNATFKGLVARAGGSEPCVYKPTAGERPLRDFPYGTLANREVGSYLVSEATGWAIVPPTVLRDGPHGPGMAQLWIEVDPNADIDDLLDADDERLRHVAVLDAILNNTDRKGGHLLVTPSGHIHGVDHGVTFSAQPKLRTILWAWRGTPFAKDELAVLRSVRAQLDADLGRDLGALLAPVELVTTIARVDALISSGRFPQPSPGWPAVPWPPF